VHAVAKLDLMAMKNNHKELRYRMAPISAYYFRTYAPSMLGGSLGFVIPAFIFGDPDKFTTWQIVVCLLGLALGANIFWIMIVMHRPQVLINRDGIDLVIADFFEKKYAKWLYASKGYGDDYLAMTIDYALPCHIDWRQLSNLRIEKNYFMYKVHAVGSELRGKVLYASFSHKKAKEFKRSVNSIMLHRPRPRTKKPYLSKPQNLS